jgi:hypothetical protein
MSLVARGNVSLTPGSYIWFGSLELIITKEGDDLDLVPPTNKPADFPEPIDDLRRRSDELRNTWPNKFSLPGLPQAAQACHNKKVRRPSTHAHHLSPKAGEVPEDLPEQLGHAIADTLASTETSSNSDLEDDYDNNYQGSTDFVELQRMQCFLHVSDYLLNDEPLHDDFNDRFKGYELSWPQKGQAPTQHSICQAYPPLSSSLIPLLLTLKSLCELMFLFLTPFVMPYVQIRHAHASYMPHTCILHMSYRTICTQSEPGPGVRRLALREGFDSRSGLTE